MNKKERAKVEAMLLTAMSRENERIQRILGKDVVDQADSDAFDHIRIWKPLMKSMMWENDLDADSQKTRRARAWTPILLIIFTAAVIWIIL